MRDDPKSFDFAYGDLYPSPAEAARLAEQIMARFGAYGPEVEEFQQYPAMGWNVRSQIFMGAEGDLARVDYYLDFDPEFHDRWEEAPVLFMGISFDVPAADAVPGSLPEMVPSEDYGDPRELQDTVLAPTADQRDLSPVLGKFGFSVQDSDGAPFLDFDTESVWFDHPSHDEDDGEESALRVDYWQTPRTSGQGGAVRNIGLTFNAGERWPAYAPARPGGEPLR